MINEYYDYGFDPRVDDFDPGYERKQMLVELYGENYMEQYPFGPPTFEDDPFDLFGVSRGDL
jgi:hypothetical protein